VLSNIFNFLLRSFSISMESIMNARLEPAEFVYASPRSDADSDPEQMTLRSSRPARTARPYTMQGGFLNKGHKRQHQEMGNEEASFR
jgi:hypothetical protein